MIGIPIVWTVVLAFQRVRLATLRKTGLFGELTLDNIDRVLHTPGSPTRSGPLCSTASAAPPVR
ncbi:hypothetical protein V2I01_40910 [Micromonospora sp. BRA006-A]|nr:hypothetical protein [Micromonospora sp. BRA006-A]